MKPSILVVDDNPEIRKVLTYWLEDKYTVTTVEDGEEAIAALTDGEFDLLILDVEMPKTDGWETLRVIKDPDSGFPVPVIMLTCVSDTESFLKSAIIGAEYFVEKPFDPERLLYTVEKALSQHTTRA